MKKVIGLFLIYVITSVSAATAFDLFHKKKEQAVPEHQLDAPEAPRNFASIRNSGKVYYDSLVEKASKRRRAIQASFHYSTEDGAFNCKGCSVPLCGLIFGKDTVTIEDIYLFSKLSDDNKVRINNCDALAPKRGGVPIGGVGVPFGGFRDDLYTTLLAPVELALGASWKEYSTLISAIRRFDIGSSDCFSVALGFLLPLIRRHHSLDLNFKGGELFRSGFIPDTTQRENSLKQFFRDFSSLTDFINRAVLEANGIDFQAKQSKTGIGDVSLFGSVEYHWRHTLEAGLALVFPSGGKGSGSRLWEPILGNGGAYQFNPFIQGLFYTAVPYTNPFARIALELSAEFSTDNIRIPTLVTNDVRTQVKNVEGLSAPDTFQNFYVDPFSELDSGVPLFAAKKPRVTKKIGTKILFGIGNYAYNLFNVDLRWGLFYDFYHKSTDSFGVKADCNCDPKTIDICTMEKCSDETSHSLGTNLTYKFSNMFEFAAGGTFTFLGKNVPKQRNVYFSFVAVF